MSIFDLDRLKYESSTEAQTEMTQKLMAIINEENRENIKRAITNCKTEKELAAETRNIKEQYNDKMIKLGCFVRVFKQTQPLTEKFMEALLNIDRLNLEDIDKANIMICYGKLMTEYMFNLDLYKSFNKYVIEMLQSETQKEDLVRKIKDYIDLVGAENLLTPDKSNIKDHEVIK